MRYRITQTIDRDILVEVDQLRVRFPEESEQYPDDDLAFLQDALDNDAFENDVWNELASDYIFDALFAEPHFGVGR